MLDGELDLSPDAKIQQLEKGRWYGDHGGSASSSDLEQAVALPLAPRRFLGSRDRNLSLPLGDETEHSPKPLVVDHRRRIDTLIASTYLAGTNTRRVRRALAAVFTNGVGKDVVSRVWRKVKTDWDAWNRRDLGTDPIVRLILDGTVVRVRLDRKATRSRCWS